MPHKTSSTFYHFYVLYLKNERIDWLRGSTGNPRRCAQRPFRSQPMKGLLPLEGPRPFRIARKNKIFPISDKHVNHKIGITWLRQNYQNVYFG